jgi:hypothetical protein
MGSNVHLTLRTEQYIGRPCNLFSGLGGGREFSPRVFTLGQVSADAELQAHLACNFAPKGLDLALSERPTSGRSLSLWPLMALTTRCWPVFTLCFRSSSLPGNAECRSSPLRLRMSLQGRVPVEMNVLMSQPKASQNGMVDAMSFGTNTICQRSAPPSLGRGIYHGGKR